MKPCWVKHLTAEPPPNCSDPASRTKSRRSGSDAAKVIYPKIWRPWLINCGQESHRNVRMPQPFAMRSGLRHDSVSQESAGSNLAGRRAISSLSRWFGP